MSARVIIDAKLGHRPHPGLHIKATLEIRHHGPSAVVGGRRSPLPKFTLIVPVPNRVPFDKIEGWWQGVEAPAGLELWELMQAQRPKLSERVKKAGLTRWTQHNRTTGRLMVGHCPNFYLAEPHIVGYVHKDGSPYDIQPFLRDRVSNLLSDEGETTH